MRLLSSFSVANIYDVTGCNIIGSNMLGGQNGDDFITTDFNNVTAAYDAWPVGANDIALNPLYVDAANGNFTYTDPTVLVSDAIGRPIGSNMSFAATITLSTSTLSFTEGSGFEVDVTVPDFLPIAQPKIRPFMVLSETARNVKVTSLDLSGTDAANWNLNQVLPLILNKSSAASVKVMFDPVVDVPTYGLTAAVDVISNDLLSGSLSVALTGDAVGSLPSTSNQNWSLYD